MCDMNRLTKGAGGILIGLLLASFAPADVKTVTLPKSSPQIAVAPATGMIAALDVSGGKVVLYPDLSSGESLENAIVQAVGATPKSIVHKQLKDAGVFLVTCQGESALYVLNDQTGAVIKKIVLAGQAPNSVSAPVVVSRANAVMVQFSSLMT